jgi:hypothetical protein
MLSRGDITVYIALRSCRAPFLYCYTLYSRVFQAFTIFCGLGINNCLLYDEVARAAARQAVALEVLSYHAAISAEEVQKLKVRVTGHFSF